MPQSLRLLALMLFFKLSVQYKRIRLDLQKGPYQGDILINNKGRNGVLNSQRWPQATIYYDYGANWSQDHKDMLKHAMAEIEQYTCVRFTRRTNQTSFVRIINDTGCYSNVGFVGGIQKLSLADAGGVQSGCWWQEYVSHELLHAVGLWHEQQRKDRDDFISLNFTTVPEEWRFAFAMQSSSNTYGVPYDYNSIMHYSKTAFSNSSLVTIRTKDDKYADIIGHAKHGSINDWLKINRIYECPGTPTSVLRTNPNCKDNYPSCGIWVSLGLCASSSDFMQGNCYKSCNTFLCEVRRNNSSAGNDYDCVDSDSLCSYWAKNKECSDNAPYMKENCKKSCGLC